MHGTTTPNTGALAGIRVIDLTRVLGGPYGTQVLADHGADVIKVEPPQGDEVRDWGPPFRDGTASYFVGVNRNKRMAALDLTKPEGREVLLRLLETADVLVHNFKTGTMEKWGIGYEEVLKARFPKLIYCHITGFGNDGPYGGLPGYDAAVQAMAGLMSINGSQETGPMRMGTPLVDLGMGLNTVIGVLLALHHRNRTGEGQAIDVSLYDSAVALLHPQAANYLMSGKIPQLIGNAHPNISPYDSFRCGDRYIFLAVGNDRQFRKMCEIMGAPQLPDDPRFLTNAKRVENRAALRGELESLFADHDAVRLADTLARSGVPAGAVMDVGEVMTSPHTAHREMLLEEGSYRGTGIPVKMSKTKPRLRWAPRAFNVDGAEVLREAGYSDAEIEKLQAGGISPRQRRKGGGE
jgi:crotonobetainyl-CoA:carnitine CoA-transferase CaiB-like acyl-CoA transferase